MKKGQVTLFIVVGIVILLLIGLSLALWKTYNERRPPEDTLSEEVNVALKPLQTYVHACLQNTAKDVLTQTALHGGYYEPEKFGFVAIPTRPTESRALEVFPGVIVPYWSYLVSSNTCTTCALGSEQPPLTGNRYPAIEYQVERAIENHLGDCLKHFEAFPDYEITPQSSPSVQVSFGEGSTTVNLTYVLAVQLQSETTSTLRRFTVDVDIPMRKAYEYADRIRKTMDSPLQPYFPGLTLEVITLEAVGPEDEEPIPPPFGGTSLTSNPGPFWTIPHTRAIIARSLENNVNNVQVLGAPDMDFVFTNDSLVNNYYANYYFSVPNPEEEFSVRFFYMADWEPYLAIHPGGQLIKPQVVSFSLPFVPSIKKKDFQYDVSYPLVTQLRTVTRAGEEFLFQFPVEVNLRNNNPVASDALSVSEPDYGYCDPELAGGTLVNFSTHDEQGLGVSATLRYNCLSNSCPLGIAQGGTLKEVKLPSCIGGVIEASREGYRSERVSFDSIADTEDVVDITLVKRTPVTINARGRYVQRTPTYNDIVDGLLGYSWTLAEGTYTFDVPQKLLFVITPRDDPEDARVLTYPDDAQSAHELSLYPGVYDITAVVTEELAEPKIIRGGEVCVDTEPLNPFGGEKCEKINDITLGGGTYVDEQGQEQAIEASEVYVGGFEWTETTRNVTITQEMLDRGTIQLDVPVIYLPDVQQIDDSRNDLSVFDKLQQLSLQIPFE